MSWALVQYATQQEYRLHFERACCSGPIMTHDGIAVRFRKSDFDHCFFESSRRNGVKDVFSTQRAARVDWIKAALQDPSAVLKAGWDRKKRRYDHQRRVVLVRGNYVIVLALTGKQTADFVTAYVMDTPESLKKLTAAPAWKPPP